jgi:tripartite-type tricarboxylate transporter receptor subunit TctC
MSTMYFEERTGTAFKSVHFDGGGPATTALAGGHVDLRIGKEAIEAIGAAIAKGVQRQEFQAGMLNVGLVLRYMETAKFAAYWDQVEAQTKPLLEALFKEQK